MNVLYQHRRAQGLCGQCGDVPAPLQVMCRRCVDANAARRGAFSLRHPERQHHDNATYAARHQAPGAQYIGHCGAWFPITAPLPWTCPACGWTWDITNKETPL